MVINVRRKVRSRLLRLLKPTSAMARAAAPRLAAKSSGRRSCGNERGGVYEFQLHMESSLCAWFDNSVSAIAMVTREPHAATIAQ
jgi:hypothetical protein